MYYTCMCVYVCVIMRYHVLLIKIDSNYQLCYNSVTSNSLSTDKEMGYDNKYFHNPPPQNHVYTLSFIPDICFPNQMDILIYNVYVSLVYVLCDSNQHYLIVVSIEYYI